MLGLYIHHMPPLRNSTLVFLKRGISDQEEICLAMKKRGFGVGRWNGVGGKVHDQESLEDAAKRETQEEIGVQIKELEKVAELSFFFPHRPDWDQLVHVYFCHSWSGEIMESEEMRPQWFLVSQIPFENMWSDDILWLPRLLSGKLLRASFTFGEQDEVIDHNLNYLNTQ